LARKRIYEIAKELGVSSKELIAKLEEMGMPGLKAANSVDEDEHSLIVNVYQDATAAPAPPPADERAPAGKLERKEKKAAKAPHGEPCPPVVSVLGHIDHGKTTLLDAIRHSHLADREAGGITQRIAAYQADLHGQRITFIDTPGHKAFTGMRARGAQATDIAILVVAADDGIMAQTVEAIDHIKAAGIPMIVAVNKIDKPNADINKVMSDLAKHGLTPEAWGGETITVSISALQGENIEELLEMILLVAEMEDLRADPNGQLEAVIIESHLSAGRGAVATAVIKDGTLREKDWIVAGSTCGRVKALLDSVGNRVREAIPGQAVQILGLTDVPPAGTRIERVDDQTRAKQLSTRCAEDAKKPRRARRPVSIDNLFEQVEVEKLQLILKAESTGALEAVRREMETLNVEGVELNILHAGVGTITESDVLLASSVTGEALVVGFGVKADANATRLADRDGVLLFSYDIIYDLVNDIERALKRRLAPEYTEIQLGIAEVRNLFKVPAGIVAGCYVEDGKVARRGRIRVERGSDEIFVGEIASLRRFDDDVREVPSGRECGIRIKDFDGVQVGDRLIVFELQEVER